MYVCLHGKVPAGDVHGQHAPARPANRICNRTIVCRLAAGRVEWVSNVHLCHVSRCPAGRGLPAAHGTWSSQSAKQPSPRCSRNDPLTLLIALSQHGIRQPSRLSRLMLGSETAATARHMAALRLAAGAASTGPERRATRPTDWRTALKTVAAVLIVEAWRPLASRLAL